MGKKIDGKALSEKLLFNIFKKVQDIRTNNHMIPIGWYYMAIVTVGDDPASQVYVKNKLAAAEKAGIKATHIKLGGTLKVGYFQVKAILEGLNSDRNCKGIILQLPLPPYLREETQNLLNIIAPAKDIDGFRNSQLFFNGSEYEGLVPCTPKGIMKIINDEGYELRGKHVVIINRSNVVGKPLAMMMLNHDATVTICHSCTENLKEICKTADVLVSAVGKPHFIKKDWIKPGSFLIDVGICKMDNKVFGDIDPECYESSGWYTPVPGGVGPMTVAMLISNFVKTITSI